MMVNNACIPWHNGAELGLKSLKLSKYLFFVDQLGTRVLEEAVE